MRTSSWSQAGRPETRRRVRLAAAWLSLADAVVYLLIGLQVVRVVEPASTVAPSMLAFGGFSAAAFALGAALLWRFDRRPLWVLGAAFQAFVVLAYFSVAPQRTPPYEFWGLALKATQLALLAALTYLAVLPTGVRALPHRTG